MVNGWLCCTSQPKVRSPPPEESTQSYPPPSIPTTSPAPCFIQSMRAIIREVQLVDPSHQIDPLMHFIEYLLLRIKASAEEESTSSFPLDSVACNTRLAADIIDNISKEALKCKDLDLFKEMGNLALSGLKMVGEAHWPILGLSMVAYALERCVTVRYNVSECMELLETIVFLAKDLKQFKELMPGESERLCLAVRITAEGAVMCCDYMSKGTISYTQPIYLCGEKLC